MKQVLENGQTKKITVIGYIQNLLFFNLLTDFLSIQKKSFRYYMDMSQQLSIAGNERE
jgi:hypothetical protein